MSTPSHSSSWLPHVFAIETYESDWPVSFSILSAIITILFLFSSAFALSLLYHWHDQWKKLKRGRHLIYTQAETIIHISSRNNTACLLNAALTFKYQLWPCIEEECRSVHIHSARLFQLNCGCTDHKKRDSASVGVTWRETDHTTTKSKLCPAPELVASTLDGTLVATFSDQQTCPDDSPEKRHFHVEAAPLSQNHHRFEVQVQLLEGGGSTRGVGKLEICFATNCDSSFSKDGTENLVYHNVCLYGTVP